MTPNPSLNNQRCRVIRITADDSPNVRERREVIPGIVTYEQLQQRRVDWDPVMQCVGLDAQFWEGTAARMFPLEWLDHARRRAGEIGSTVRKREAKAMGVDPGEGVANTAWCIVDEWGVLHLRAMRTPDTSSIPYTTRDLIKEYNLDPKRVMIDRGGGGKEHSDILRKMGYKVRTVGFGEAPTVEPKRGLTQVEDRVNVREERSAYKNRRAEMYALLRMRLNPTNAWQGFGIPSHYSSLLNQLSPIPLLRDGEGRLLLLPKNLPTGRIEEFGDDGSDGEGGYTTLTQLIGHSPDEADSLVLAIYGMVRKSVGSKAGAVGYRRV